MQIIVAGLVLPMYILPWTNRLASVHQQRLHFTKSDVKKKDKSILLVSNIMAGEWMLLSPNKDKAERPQCCEV